MPKPQARVKGPVPTAEPARQPGSQYKNNVNLTAVPKQIIVSRHGSLPSDDEQLNLNEGVVYVAGGIGVKTKMPLNNCTVGVVRKRNV